MKANPAQIKMSRSRNRETDYSTLISFEINAGLSCIAHINRFRRSATEFGWDQQVQYI